MLIKDRITKMATYVVTTSNWNDPSFWASINISGSGHTLDLSALPSNFTAVFDPETGTLIISDGATSFTIGDSGYGGGSDATLGGSSQFTSFDTFLGPQGFADYYGTTGNDIFVGGAGDDYATGDAGDDSLVGNGGNDTLDGGSGNDTLDGGSGDDTLYGGFGNDSIKGGEGDDLIQGQEGDDTIEGGGGDDTIQATDGSGFDVISGGSTGTDNDTLELFGPSGAVVTFTDLEDGSYAYDNGLAGGTFFDFENIIGTSAYDVFDLSGYNTSVTVTYTSTGTGTITDGIDTLNFTGIEEFRLGDQDDYVDASLDQAGITGDQPGIVLDAGDGADTILGGRGGDTIDGGAGNDSIEGDYGDDVLSGGAGDDTLVGGSGNDSMSGGSGNDQISGGIEGDTLDGGDGDDTLDGGTGDDSISGGGGDDIFIYAPGDGDDTITDFNTGNTGTLDDGDSTNNDYIDLSGYYDHISELHADQADDGVLNQSNTTDTRGNAVDYSDNSDMGSGSMTFSGASADGSSFTQENTGVVCFTSGTAIRTPLGDTLVEELHIGDLVNTMDNGPQPICWIGRRTLYHASLAAKPNLRPVLIKRGVLGVERDLLVSQQHGMLVGRRGGFLARAKYLAQTDPGIRIANGKRCVTYIHLMFEAHQIIFAENAPSESFYPGPMALTMMGSDQKSELLHRFPEMLDVAIKERPLVEVYGETARAFLAKKVLSALAMQHNSLSMSG